MSSDLSLKKNSLKSISFLVLLALGLAAFFAPKSTGISVEWPNTPHTSDRKSDAFGQLPLSFEINQGQADAHVKYLARGQGYGIFLTDNGAAFSISGSALQMRLKDSAASPQITGVDQLPGKVNYLIGNKSAEWRTNIPTYERVRYAEIYPGIDLIYYGNQRQLEYDFVIAPGASLKQIRLAFDGADKLKLNRNGDLILKSGAQEITLKRPQAYQDLDNQRRAVPVKYSLNKRGEVVFHTGNYDQSRPLVIDPILVYSTFLGGSGQDTGNSIAVDSSGSVYIAGQTASLNFPTSSSLQATNGGGTDAFVAKLNANGSALIYSTFLGGVMTDNATSIAVDAAGNAYITGETNSSNFPVLNALHPTLNGFFSDAFVAELNSTGSALVYSTYLGGHSDDRGNAIALDNSGNAYIAGATLSSDFPTTNPAQANRAGHTIFKSTNAAGNWAPSDAGLTASVINDIVVQPGNASIVYAATDTVIFKSTDGGANWSPLPASPAFILFSIALDPVNPAIIYLATNGGVFKSTDGGNSFTPMNNGLQLPIRTIAIDPVTPTILYAANGNGPYFKSVDGGASWAFNFPGLASKVDSVIVDPNTPSTLYADTNLGVFKSTDSGNSWVELNTGISDFLHINSITINPANNALYVATSFGVWRGANGGSTWANIGNLSFGVVNVAVDPTNPSVLYANTIIAVQKSVDGGNSWSESITGYPGTRISSLVVNPNQPSTLFIGTTSSSDAFVTKLSAGGASQVYSTYLGGHILELGNGIAVDASGNAYVTGSTTSNDFPTVNAIQTTRGDNLSLGDAFITKLNASGSAFVYSTFLGGQSIDSGNGVAVDTNGNAYVCGSTASQNFPIVNAFQSQNLHFADDVFVTKVNAAGSALVYSTFIGGDSSDNCAAIAIDATGSAYVTGITTSANYPVLSPVQATGGGTSHDAFITKLAPSGSSLIHSTYLGGSSTDSGRGIAVDSSHNIYVVGTTTSTDFPTKNPLQPGFGGGSDVFIAKLRPAPDIEVTVNDTPHLVNFGNNLTYTITVKNIGELPATGVTLADAIPAGAALVSANSTAGTCSGTTTINCNIGTLNGGATATITIVVTPPALSFINNTATATLNETDSFPGNNTVTTESIVIFADLALTKKTAQSLVVPGGTVTFSLIVNNKGGVPIDVSVTDQLPDGLTLVNCSATGNGVCGGTANVVSVEFPQISATASETILLTVRVSPSASAGTVISNTAIVTAPVPDPDFSNNTSTASVTVATVPVLQKSNGLIAFERTIFGPGSEPSGIYTVKSDLTDSKLFPGISVNSGAGRPEWSPDGSKLAFQVLNEIHVINADGTGLMKIVDNASERNRGITWSPNGSQIAYIGAGGPSEDTVYTIHIANADGTGSYRLPGSPALLWAVDWSPDGTKFICSNFEELFVINTDGTGKQQLTTVQQTQDGMTADIDPRWSPDGTKILFTRYRSSIAGTTWMMNADGSNQRKLLNFDGYSPYWSPDGRSFAMVSSGNICTVNIDNTNLNCPNTLSGTTPSWQRLPNPNPTPTPTPVPTFSLSGKLTVDNTLFFAEVELNGPVHARRNVDINNHYEFINLPAGEYTVTPINAAYDFSPPSRTVTITNADLTGVDFAGTFVPATITGHVKDNNGNPLAGIKLTLGLQASIPGDVFTDANGSYTFTGVPRGGTYILIPDQASLYDFNPTNKFIQNLVGTEVVDFVGTKALAHVIAGRVVDPITGQGIGNVRVNLTQDDFLDGGFTFTNANGDFSFGERKHQHSFAVLVPDDATFVFEPTQNPANGSARIEILSLTSDQNLRFTASRRNTVQFSVSSVLENEAHGTVEVLVTRSGDAAGPATVNFITHDTAGLAACNAANGIASERCDYSSTFGTLRFAAFERDKSIVIPLVNDVHVEGKEAFTITLNTAIGAQLGSMASSTVTIDDDDTTPIAQNPIDGVDPFVRQQYIDFLGRLPDSVGFANWVATLNGCPNGGFGENVNPSCDRVHVSSGFFLSDEFRGRGYFAYRFYEVGLDRKPLYAEFVPDMTRVGGAQSPESELLSKAAYADDFVQRHEFLIRYSGLSNPDFVNALEQNAEITLTNKADLVAALNANQKTKAQVLREIVESKAVEDKFFIRAFVAMQYFGYLRRDPDTVGYDNWVTTLTNDPSNFRHMIFGFLFSNEYRRRFGP